MTVIPESKLGLQGNHQRVILPSRRVALIHHSQAFSFLLHNHISSREKGDTPLTWNFYPLAWDSAVEKEKGEITYEYHMESHLEDGCPCQKAWLSSGRYSSSEDKHLPLTHLKIIPFQIFPMSWHTGSQVEGISRVFQEHPERRSWWRQDSCLWQQRALIPPKLLLMWIWKQHRLKSGNMESTMIPPKSIK